MQFSFKHLISLYFSNIKRNLYEYKDPRLFKCNGQCNSYSDGHNILQHNKFVIFIIFFDWFLEFEKTFYPCKQFLDFMARKYTTEHLNRKGLKYQWIVSCNVTRNNVAEKMNRMHLYFNRIDPNSVTQTKVYFLL